MLVAVITVLTVELVLIKRAVAFRELLAPTFRATDVFVVPVIVAPAAPVIRPEASTVFAETTNLEVVLPRT